MLMDIFKQYIVKTAIPFFFNAMKYELNEISTAQLSFLKTSQILPTKEKKTHWLTSITTTVAVFPSNWTGITSRLCCKAPLSFD